jgi:hypothetical protein
MSRARTICGVARVRRQVVGHRPPPPTAPDAPTIIAVDPSNARVSVTFTEPANNRSPILYYNVSTFTGAGGSTSVPDVSGAGLSNTVTGLTNGTAYTFKVVAVNAVGSSAPSAPSSSVTPVTTPSAPTALAVVTNGGTYIILSFTAPSQPGGYPITNYKVSTDNGTSFTALDPEDILSPITITGLTVATAYNIKLLAVNDAGDGSESAMLPVTTITPTAPGAPTINYVLPGNGEVYVYFSRNSTGGIPSNYEFSTDGGATYTEIDPADTISPFNITGLTNGTTYNVRARALNGVGTSDGSNTVSVTPVDPSVANPWLYYDPSIPASYTGSGQTVSNLGTFGAKNGTISSLVTYNAGIKGGVFDFPGTTGATISFTSLDFGTKISVAAWIYPRFTENINGLFTNTGANVHTNGFKFQWNWWRNGSRVLSFQAGNGSVGDDDYSSVVIQYNAWQHIGYVFDKTTGKVVFFYNGIPVSVGSDVTTVANINTNAAFNIGGYIGGLYTMNAQLGYIKIYNNLLDATQMDAEYNSTKSRFITP